MDLDPAARVTSPGRALTGRAAAHPAAPRPPAGAAPAADLLDDLDAGLDADLETAMARVLRDAARRHGIEV